VICVAVIENSPVRRQLGARFFAPLPASHNPVRRDSKAELAAFVRVRARARGVALAIGIG
jgi:hypothetical protein